MTSNCTYGSRICKNQGKGLRNKPTKKVKFSASVRTKSIRAAKFKALLEKIEIAASHMNGTESTQGLDFCIIHSVNMNHSNHKVLYASKKSYKHIKKC